MNKYIVRQPIKQMDGKTFGYEILFSLENELYNQSGDYAVAETISSFLMQNNNKLKNDVVNFMTFTPNLLFKNTPKLFKAEELVIQIEDNVIIHPLAQRIIQRYRENGYQFCINDFQFIPRYFALMEYIDYIKVDITQNKDVESIQNLLNLAKGFEKKCILTGINNLDLYKFAMQFPVDYIQGSYVAEAMTNKTDKMAYLQSNFFQLVVAVTSDEPNMEEIEDIIVRDASLTYTLLRMVNSVHYALRHRTASVRQALMVLGINQLKQWVYLMSLGDSPADKQNEEMLRISYIRANFCSDLYDFIPNLGVTKSEAYLMGMFSTMEAMVDAPISELMEQIPISDEIKDAIISQKGRCGLLYSLVLSYEKADWKNITKYAEELGIDPDNIAQIYLNCVETVKKIWDSFVRYDDAEDLQTQLKDSIETEKFTS